MARKNLKKEKDLMKEKTDRLSTLISEFLERDITWDCLKEKPEEIHMIKDILEKNLWEGIIDPNDPDWQFESDLCVQDMPERAEYIRQKNIDTGVESILNLHRFLKKGFWREFKENLIAYNKENGNNPYLNERFIKFNPGHDVIIHATFPDKIYFFSNSFEAIRSLMNLIAGFRPEQFKICADDSCGKLFLQASGHTRYYCSGRCASRSIERRKREENKSVFNEYHKAYYNKYLRKGGKDKTPDHVNSEL